MLFKISEICSVFFQKAVLWKLQGEDITWKHLWNCSLISFLQVKGSTLTSLHSNSKHYAEETSGIKGYFFFPITWASWGKVFQTAQPNLSPFAYSECPGPAACPWWRLGRCQDVVLFPCSSKFIQKPLLAALWENVTKISPNPDFITSLICSILCIERTHGSNLGDCNYWFQYVSCYYQPTSILLSLL